MSIARRHFIAIASLTMGCSGTGQPELVHPAYASSTPPEALAAGDWIVTLDEATVAFGPAYFCAAASGSATLLRRPLHEITAVGRVDALVATPQRLADVRGFEGEIRSASYDYGIHWFLDESSPAPDASAVNGHSARFAGTARREDEAVSFVAEVDVIAQFQGQRAVPSAPASASIRSEDVRLDVRFDVGAWLTGIDFDAAVEAGTEILSIRPGSTDHNGIVIAMVATHPPELVWSGAGATTP